jgi:putative holliday junction resolvase
MQATGRIMALDFGNVRTGVAVSDPLQMIASPHSVIEARSTEELLDALHPLFTELEPVTLVIGMPLDQHGGKGPRAEKTLAFVEVLRERLDIPVAVQDERFTTVEAERMLTEARVRRKKRKQVVDKIAAAHILQSWLDRQASERRLRS